MTNNQDIGEIQDIPEIQDIEHNVFMERAAQLSLKNIQESKGGPFGAVIVNTETREIVGQAANSVTSTNDPTAHAEVNTIRDACKKLNRFDLSGHTIYTSCEPCPMCFGAIYWARLDKVYYANTHEDAKNIDFDDSYIYDEIKKEPKDRTLKFKQINNETARNVFSQWKEKSDKVEY